MKCPNCNKKMIISGNYDYDDMGMEGLGIVTDLVCGNKNCNCEGILIYEKINKEDTE